MFYFTTTQADLSPSTPENKSIWDWKRAGLNLGVGLGIEGELSTDKPNRLLFSQRKFLCCSSLFTEATGYWLWTTPRSTKEKGVPLFLCWRPGPYIFLTHLPPKIGLPHMFSLRIRKDAGSFLSYWSVSVAAKQHVSSSITKILTTTSNRTPLIAGCL